MKTKTKELLNLTISDENILMEIVNGGVKMEERFANIETGISEKMAKKLVEHARKSGGGIMIQYDFEEEENGDFLCFSKDSYSFEEGGWIGSSHTQYPMSFQSFLCGDKVEEEMIIDRLCKLEKDASGYIGIIKFVSFSPTSTVEVN